MGGSHLPNVLSQQHLSLLSMSPICIARRLETAATCVLPVRPLSTAGRRARPHGWEGGPTRFHRHVGSSDETRFAMLLIAVQLQSPIESNLPFAEVKFNLIRHPLTHHAPTPSSYIPSLKNHLSIYACYNQQSQSIRLIKHKIEVSTHQFLADRTAGVLDDVTRGAIADW